jgi:SAM-dependent methyltransferase
MFKSAALEKAPGVFRGSVAAVASLLKKLKAALIHPLRVVELGRRRAKANMFVNSMREAGKGDPMQPNDTLVKYLGIGGGFEAIGQQWVDHLRNLCQLDPTDRVLDIGCGLGRVAIPLSRYLDESGEYRGFDVAPAAVDWCVKRITPQHTNFRFEQVRVYNKEYNPSGRQAADSLVFPYEDDFFDCALATSVFTHMRPAGVQRYLHEARRVLRRHGKCLFTFFILDDVSRSHMAGGDAEFSFEHEMEGFWSIDRYLPELAIAYDEAEVGRMLGNAGLDVTTTYYGSWSGRGAGLNGQDIVVAQRR